MPSTSRRIVRSVVICSLLFAVRLDFAQTSQENGRSDANATELPGGPNTTWSLAAVGDTLIATRVMQFNNPLDPRFQDLVKVIRAADVGFLNLEGSLFSFSEYTGWPAAGEEWQAGPPEAGEDLKAMGFNLFNYANNHTMDWGVEGMRLTLKHLDEMHVVHAGAGMNLGEASRPGYLETAKGRFALIGLASTFTPSSPAGASRQDVMGRPGLNALRVDRRYEADPATFRALREVASKFNPALPPNDNSPFWLFPSVPIEITRANETHTIEGLNRRDEQRILGEVRNAAKLADHVIVNSHSHESGKDATTPPDWLVQFARKCLDAGAITYIVHGPHLLKGIEIYKGKPIFYSLGDFVFHDMLYDPLPADMYEQFDLPDTALASDLEWVRYKGDTFSFPSNPIWYESIVAVATFKGAQLTDLKLYPIDLAQKAPWSQRGTPRMADEAKGRQIIERIANESAAFGTKIVYENGIGVWHP
jgi:poly-gamma-glutamate capsule biosynthesis protein CapA/YwtB (metallophosphatase superfamily)